MKSEGAQGDCGELRTQGRDSSLQFHSHGSVEAARFQHRNWEKAYEQHVISFCVWGYRGSGIVEWMLENWLLKRRGKGKLLAFALCPITTMMPPHRDIAQDNDKRRVSGRILYFTMVQAEYDTQQRWAVFGSNAWLSRRDKDDCPRKMQGPIPIPSSQYIYPS